MACASLSIPASPVASNCLCRSESSKDLQKRATIQRSYSDNHLVRRFNRIHATSTQPKLKNSRSMGLFPFQFSASSILPSSLRSFLFDPETSKNLSIVEKETSNADQEIMENVEDNTEGQEIKRANWVERLLELRTQWRNRKQQKDGFDEIEVSDEEEEFGDCSCDGEEGGCEVSYSSDEEGGGEKRVDRESFSRFLAKVPLSDTKLFSQLAFLCNMAYVIQDIRVSIYPLNFFF